jgi:hypothetical protein
MMTCTTRTTWLQLVDVLLTSKCQLETVALHALPLQGGCPRANPVTQLYMYMLCRQKKKPEATSNSLHWTQMEVLY